MSLPSAGVGFVTMAGWATIMSFAVLPYYRGHRGYGSPLAVRTGLMVFALMPLTWATAGNVSRVLLFSFEGADE